ncbi:hypothetical protein OsI_20157 [Oryza sativa Indica Group]|uniref:AP2/ERF domain-containing protein n=1 Tax=Oryza sativa subsp. indica TaxID=39946 RepID=A2Y587_ORYSI|nr:hypothetical protein OsI_20157 [Oryza sativa Indica Group]
MEPNYSDYHPNSVPFDAYYEHGHGHLDDHGHGHHHLIPAHPEPSYSYGNWSFLHADATATSSSESSSASASSGAAHIVGASGPSASFVRQLHFGGEYYDDDAADISALMEAASISCWTTNGGAVTRRSGAPLIGVRKRRGQVPAESRTPRATAPRVCLATFNTPEQAALAYDQAALSVRGPGAVLNYPLHRVRESLRTLELGAAAAASESPVLTLKRRHRIRKRSTTKKALAGKEADEAPATTSSEGKKKRQVNTTSHSHDGKQDQTSSPCVLELEDLGTDYLEELLALSEEQP